jgi:dihydropyrimidinase
MATLIKGGRVITAADDYVADVLIEAEQIAQIGVALEADSADSVIDAAGKYVLPGCIDPHTHFHLPVGDWLGSDDFTSGTTSAAFGGTTTHIDFCLQTRGETFAETLAKWREKQDGNGVIDSGFHLAVSDLEAGGTLEELAQLPDEGITSYKLFMAYPDTFMVDDATLFRTMQVAAETGAIVMLHAENGHAIEVLVRDALAAGKTEPVYHSLTRPPELEGEATNRAIQLAHVAGCTVYIVHVSCRDAVEPVARARQMGWDVWGETCTQYLSTSIEDLERADFEGAKYVFTPPPRAKHHQDRLWHALRHDELSVLSSDHSPFSWDQKLLGQDDFSKIANGAPGVEHRLHMLHHFGVREGRLSLSRMVEVLATNPAKIFGLYPRKGTIAVGSDADLVVFDPSKTVTLSAATHHSKCDFNIFEGIEVTGAPDLVLVRGNTVVENDALVARPGMGRFIGRARAGEQLRPRTGIAS